jgi:hypothetical protein
MTAAELMALDEPEEVAVCWIAARARVENGVVLCDSGAEPGGSCTEPATRICFDYGVPGRVAAACDRHESLSVEIALFELGDRGLAWWLDHLAGKHNRPDLALLAFLGPEGWEAVRQTE